MLLVLICCVLCKLVFIDVYVDPSEHVYPMLVAPNGSMKDMWIAKDKKA